MGVLSLATTVYPLVKEFKASRKYLLLISFASSSVLKEEIYIISKQNYQHKEIPTI